MSDYVYHKPPTVSDPSLRWFRPRVDLTGVYGVSTTDIVWSNSSKGNLLELESGVRTSSMFPTNMFDEISDPRLKVCEECYVRGFKFSNHVSINYDKEMDNYVGEVGIVTSVTGDYAVGVTFSDGEYWDYPIDNKKCIDIAVLDSITTSSMADTNIFFHCQSELGARDFLLLADRLGFGWRGERGFLGEGLGTKWGIYKEDTCYNISKGVFSEKLQCISQGYLVVDSDLILSKYS